MVGGNGGKGCAGVGVVAGSFDQLRTGSSTALRFAQDDGFWGRMAGKFCFGELNTCCRKWAGRRCGPEQ
jgi:hypothetical protein